MIYGAFFGKVSVLAFLPLGIAVNAFAQLGELFESALKRSAKVKDSGNLFPGHGGMLDRIASILFASGAYAVTAACVPFFG